ncbi:hypothetical protein [uncultured Flavobacterium sp.]|uniref:hypothetical protein n=1 Tax=uncultured Flavobacterium sp. TaxID=165435 RepID=UPI0030EB48CC|tara:strand:+ start:53588 stop:54223 length:636 start_codon:yes stop_codon:yes gene_type:complete
MKFFISIFFFSTFLFSFGQKNDIYVNEDLEVISKEEFNKNHFTEGYLYLKYETEIDSVFANINVQREKKGKISSDLLDSIKLSLSTEVNYFSENEFIVINYYPGKDACNSFGKRDMTIDRYRDYLRKIRKNKKAKQFFVCKSSEGTERYLKTSWIKDKDSIIEKAFFPLHYPCGSFVLIDSIGNYYSYKSEYNMDSIFKLLKDENTFINTD